VHCLLEQKSLQSVRSVYLTCEYDKIQIVRSSARVVVLAHKIHF
jgi:hypothetical protein